MAASCALNKTAVQIPIVPLGSQSGDLVTFLEGNKKRVYKILKKHLKKHKTIKWYLTLNVELAKTDSEGEIKTASPYFTNKCIISLHKSELKKQISNAYEVLYDRFATWMRDGSGWFLEEIIKLLVNVASYKPLKGTSYFKLPNHLLRKKALINIKNDDQLCFLWAVLAYLHPQKHHAERVSYYRKYLHKVNIKGINFPVTICQIQKFERQNNLRINVYEYSGKEIYPLFISKQVKIKQPINLLLLKNGEQLHYCLIKSLSRLLKEQGNYCNKRYYCNYCLHAFTSQKALDNHDELCSKTEAQRVFLPKQGENVLEFKNVHKQERVTFAIYADFESILLPIQGCKPSGEKSATTPVQKHEACAFSYVVTSTLKEYCKPPVVYRGKDAAQKFVQCLLKEEDEILDILYKYRPIVMTENDWDIFLNSDVCHICGKEVGPFSLRARDHCHLTGRFRGLSHPSCNIKYRLSKKIPVVLHNLKNYDAHIIMQGISAVGKEQVKCIPNNMEKYVSFSIGKHLMFIDSFQFLGASLESLVNNLASEGVGKFQQLIDNINIKIKPKLLLRKQPFPYEYVNSWEKLDEKKLPKKSDFYSSLTEEGITDSEYKHVCKIWEITKCKSIGDLCEFYVQTDTLLLACVMENFRDLCLKYYKLDPLHYVSLPGLTFDACLRFTGVQLELLTDVDKYLFFEKGIRGGISVISHRFAQANNEHLKSFDENKKSSYIGFFDCNGLYGWALKQPLPIRNFKWICDKKKLRNIDISTLGGDGTGYVFEVDLEYPKDLHDKHNLYPLAPERMNVSKDMLSPYLTQLLNAYDMKHDSKIEKLIPNLYNKKKYIVHYRTLQLYIELGLKVTKVHRAISFDEEAWVKPYVDFNMQKRKEATSLFERDFFKLMVNSFYGKCMENVRKRQRIELVTEAKRLVKLVRKPAFKSFKIFNKRLVALHLKKLKVLLNKPIYIGFCILDKSKLKMYNMHYKVILELFGEDAILLFTDTDSLMYLFFTKNMYKDMQRIKRKFDTSNFPQDHFLFSNEGKKEVGLFKDEMGGKPIFQFVGLRPKLYSVLLENEENKKAAKGVKKVVIRKHLRHSQYLSSLFEGKLHMQNMKSIRSKEHNIFTFDIKKLSLSPLDDKRYLLKDGIQSLAYGHYKLQNRNLNKQHNKQLIA